jgi:hypothetical protein
MDVMRHLRKRVQRYVAEVFTVGGGVHRDAYLTLFRIPGGSFSPD